METPWAAYHTQPLARLGIITNVTAGRIRRRLDRVRAWAGASGAVSLEVADLPAIRAAARELVERETSVLAINGGDGTAQAVLTELLGLDRPLPDIALLPGGTTNMSANDLNRSRRLAAAWSTLTRQAALPPARRIRVARPLLAIRGADVVTQYGFFVTAGAVLRGMAHFREQVGGRGLRGELAAGISLLRGLIGLARGRGDWADIPTSTVILRDGADRWEHQVLVVASTLERLLLGIRPWWGHENGPIRVTALRQRPRALLLRAPALLRGRRSPGLSPDRGYRSSNTSGLVLTDSGGFAVDGEIFTLSPDAVVELRATRPLDFLSL